MILAINNMISAVRDWQRIAGYSTRRIINQLGGTEIAVVEYKVKVSPDFGIHGRRMIFFSDLHVGSIALDAEEFRRTFEDISPEWIVFGGDLISYACYQDEAFEFLEKVVSASPNAAKIAILGNWDKRRVRWYPNSRWYEAYQKLGFHLLVNEKIKVNGINFYGVDEPRIGTPEFNDRLLEANEFNCVVSHSVDPIIDTMPHHDFKEKQLILCGHSHGGQLRIPFFGALLTSSKYWKLFEYGQYHSQRNNADLIMTSGIGTTRLPFRLFCAPEVVVIKFVPDENKLL
jgi:uncharacterized protein